MTSTSEYQDVLSVAQTYGEAVYFARPDVFETLCHEQFQMTLVDDTGMTFWTKETYLDRVRARSPFPGEASYEIIDIDVAGPIARVHLWVDVPPHRYEDHLGFVKDAGAWKLLTKVFRTAARLDEQE